MKNQTLKTILFWIFVLTIFFWMNSCRSVKKDKTQLTEIVKTNDVKKETETVKENSNVKITKKVELTDGSETETETETIEPIDPTKPSTHTDSSGKKTELNNAKKTTTKTKKKANIKKDEVVDFEAQKATLLEKEKVETKKGFQKIDQGILKVERSFPVKWILIGIGVLVAVVLAWRNRLKIVKWVKNICWV